jgi:hypothetical protein
MTTTPSVPSSQPSSPSFGSDPSAREDLGTFAERVGRLAEAQDALMGRLWHAGTEDVASLDRVADRFILTADLDLHGRGSSRRERLESWVAAGVEWYLDCRIEADDREFLAEHAPHIRYIRVPTDDDGLPKDPAWFDAVLTGLGDALHDGSIGVITCHMGVNRAPSALFRILLAQGWHELDALAAIAGARRVAQVLYAVDAFEHHVLGHLWGEVPSDPRR